MFRIARFGVWIICVSVLGVGFRDMYRSMFKNTGRNNFLAMFVLVHIVIGMTLFIIV